MRYYSRAIFSVTVTAMTCFGASPVAAQQNQTSIPVTDLGIKQVRQSSNLKLTATNVNCDSPQTFEYTVEGGPWLVPPPNTTIPGLGKGQSGTINATLDFANTPPGIYYGHVSSRCATCGWYILTACVESGEDAVIKVTVVDPAIDGQGQNLRDPGNPFANLVAYSPPQIKLNPQVSDEDMKYLDSDDRNRLRRAREGVKRAEANGRKAREAARLARKKKNDCERELARLKAEADTAKRKTDIARQDAANAEGAAKAAEKELKDFDKDKKRAAAKVKVADEGSRAQVEAEVDAKSAYGFDSPQGRRAKQRSDEAFQKYLDAKKEQEKVNNSEKARQAQADQAKSDAEAAKRAADRAKADAKAAKAKADAKEKDCKGLVKPIKEADKAVDKARDAAKHAVGIANVEEAENQKRADKAKAQAARDAAKKLDDDIKDQEKRCKTGRKEAEAEIERLRRAISVGERIGVFNEGTKRAASALKTINDKIWDTAQDYAQDSTAITVDKDGNLGIMNDDTADIWNADTAEDLLGHAVNAMNMAAEGIKNSVRSIAGLTDFQQAEILTGMRGLAMAVQSQVNAMHNPNTLASLRNETADLRRNEESYMVQEMKEKGVRGSKEEREAIYETIKQLHSDPNLLSRRLERYEKQAANCAAKLKSLKIKREKMRQGK